MAEGYDIASMDTQIRAIKDAATQLKALSGSIQAIDRNADAILAFVRVLEMSLPNPSS